MRKTVAAFHDLNHAPVNHLGRGEVFDTFTAQGHRAFGDRTALARQQIADRPQGCGLSCAVTPKQCDDFALRDLQRNTLEHQNHMVINNFNATDVKQDLTHRKVFQNQ